MKSILYPVTSSMTSRYLLQKRLTDLFLSTAVIVLAAWWLIPVLALLVALCMRGSAFLLQTRTGKRGRSFSYIRFRTARSTAWGTMERNRLGDFLERSGLDQLPLIFQVFLGRMSLVGPRPQTARADEQSSQMLKGYYARYAFKPGLTGMASIKSKNASEEDPGNIFNQYQWDCFYLRNACQGLDRRIICQTIRRNFLSIFRKKPVKTVAMPGGLVQVLKASRRMGALNN